MKKINQKEFINRIKIRFPKEEFEVLSYSSLGKPAEIKCVDCGQVIKIKVANNFLAKNKVFGCVNCHGYINKRKENLKEIEKKYYIIDSFVKETHTYYTVECKECGHIRTTTLKNLITHLECGCKTGTKRLRSEKEFIEEVNLYSDSGTYELIGKYVDQTKKVKIRHECGFVWNVWPADIIHGKASCPKCGMHESKNVRYIKNILINNNIPFEQEKLLENSRQRFDFYLENEKMKIAIEYNGEQHYKENNYFSVSLEEQKNRDLKKKKYCLDNNIKLYIIPYNYSKEEIKKEIFNIIKKFNDYPERE